MAFHLYIYVIVLIAGLMGVFGLILTLVFPKLRIWPPPSKGSWQFWYTWLLTAIWVPGPIVIGILDWNTFLYDHWSRFVIGGLLASFGVFFILWGARTLGSQQSLGLKGRLLAKGPYQYTRNPQYVGDFLFFTGIILITNSFMALVAGILAILWFALAPFAEEPWLRQQFGEVYEQYCKKVPRFLGRDSLRRKSDSF